MITPNPAVNKISIIKSRNQLGNRFESPLDDLIQLLNLFVMKNTMSLLVSSSKIPSMCVITNC